MSMKQDYLIALDQGTTSSRAILFDSHQNVVEIAQKEFQQLYPQAGYVEHDPMEIYASQSGVLTEALVRSGISPEQIAAIGITNQRETTVVWDRETGLPIYNAIVWQCRRTAPICEVIVKCGLGDYIRQATGLVVDAYFSATKIRWILDQVPGAQQRAERGELLFGTIDSWLVWKLTGGKVHVTDYTNASRTMLFNIRTLEWDECICKALNIPLCMLPEVRSSSEVYGTMNLSGVEVPLAGIAGDQQAALFGQACFEPGDAKNTYGTGCFLLMNTGGELCSSRNGLLTTIGIGLRDKISYALEGSVFVGGAVVQWLRDEMKFVENARDVEYYAQTVEDNGGVYIVPAFTGLGAPYWDMYARGGIFGITRGTKRAHIIRAAEESIAYQTKDLIDGIEADTGLTIPRLHVDGGASRDSFLMQFQADITGKPVRRPKITETTALGAAYLAGLAVGMWNSLDEIKAQWTLEREYAPAMENPRREKLLRGWKKAVSRTLDWEDHE